LARLRAENGLPVTIVRPSHTYGRAWIPTPFGSSDFTIAGRMLAGKEVPVPGEGQALWTVTHARDFALGLVGLFGRAEAIGEAFTIAGDEALTWDEIYWDIAAALGVEAKLVHVPVEVITKASPDFGEKLLGDKAWTSIFDCSKLKRLVPAFGTRTRFAEGIRESVDWILAEASRKRSNPTTEAALEKILAAWKRAITIR
ncbi:MAG: NAD-dependent epimerase/dehydratase family protein, partial [Spirochaetota bacterium]